jgi:hypothetical protein
MIWRGRHAVAKLPGVSARVIVRWAAAALVSAAVVWLVVAAEKIGITLGETVYNAHRDLVPDG